MIRHLDRFATALARLAGVLAALALVGMFLHIAYEMVLRNLFDSSTFVLDEFVGYQVSAMMFLGLGWTYLRGELLTLDLLYERLGPRGRQALDLASDTAALTLTLFLMRYMAITVVTTFQRGTVSASIARIPQYIPQSLILAGLSVFAICLAIRLLVRVSGQAVRA